MKPYVTIHSEAGDPPLMREGERGPWYPIEPGWWVGGLTYRPVFYDAASFQIVLDQPDHVGFAHGNGRSWYDRQTTDIVAITLEGDTYRMADLDITPRPPETP